jgi:hypothetical protein
VLQKKLFGVLMKLAAVLCSLQRFVPPAAKTHYGTSLANVDWLHGSAESLLTVTNLLIGESQGWGRGLRGWGRVCPCMLLRGRG